jgi:flagellar assembly protein FliH
MMTNSSRPGRAAAFATLGSESAGFRPHPRYGAAATLTAQAAQTDMPDPLDVARAEGHAQGYALGRAEAEEQADAMLAAHGRLSLAFERLDQEMEEQLRLALRDTVALLCEGVLAPLALDEQALIARIDKAVGMLARSYDERVIRLNPQDLALLSGRLRADWQVVPDAALPRGTLRVESSEGGVEDGPATWRRAIAEALRPC